jgi:peptidoglycan hydrolase CwlO-like protein
MLNRQKWCYKCGGFAEEIYALNLGYCRCDPKDDHIQELEAEVERLQSQLKRAVEIAEKVDSHVGWPVTEVTELMIELAALKGEIK